MRMESNNLMARPLARAIALYLPLDCPILDSEEWSGRGLARWTSTTWATPRSESSAELGETHR
jgi:hypothetical protein